MNLSYRPPSPSHRIYNQTNKRFHWISSIESKISACDSRIFVVIQIFIYTAIVWDYPFENADEINDKHCDCCWCCSKLMHKENYSRPTNNFWSENISKNNFRDYTAAGKIKGMGLAHAPSQFHIYLKLYYVVVVFIVVALTIKKITNFSFCNISTYISSVFVA